MDIQACIRFIDGLDFTRVGKFARVVNFKDFAIIFMNFIYDCGGRGNKICPEFAFKPFLDNFHVQKTKKSGPKTKSKSLGCFCLIGKGGIVELELFKG